MGGVTGVRSDDSGSGIDGLLRPSLPTLPAGRGEPERGRRGDFGRSATFGTKVRCPRPRRRPTRDEELRGGRGGRQRLVPTVRPRRGCPGGSGPVARARSPGARSRRRGRRPSHRLRLHRRRQPRRRAGHDDLRRHQLHDHRRSQRPAHGPEDRDQGRQRRAAPGLPAVGTSDRARARTRNRVRRRRGRDLRRAPPPRPGDGGGLQGRDGRRQRSGPVVPRAEGAGAHRGEAGPGRVRAGGWVNFEVPQGRRPAYVVLAGSSLARWAAGGTY